MFRTPVVLYFLGFLVHSNNGIDPIIPIQDSITAAPKMTTVPKYNNEMLPTLTTVFPNLIFANFTVPVLYPMSPSNPKNIFNSSFLGLPTALPTFGTVPTLNLSLPGIPTIPPIGNFTIPTFGTVPTLNLSLPGIPTIPPIGNFTIPTFGTVPTLNLSLPGIPTIPPIGNFTIPTFGTVPTLNLSLPGIPTMATVTPPAGSTFITTKSVGGATTACGTATCASDQVCAVLLNSTQICIRRLPMRRYCIDNPCQAGVKCFDNILSNTYTCFTKLDGTPGECLGIQCSPGETCYQAMGEPAKCIDVKKAPRCIGINEEFSACRSGCESTCAVPTPLCMNSTTCTSGCSCIYGYVRLNGVCEKMSKCPSVTTGDVTCSGAEVYTPCKTACENTCAGVMNPACSSHLSINSNELATCKPGCLCRPPYKRDTVSGKCIHARQCYQTTKCGANETWSKCHNCEDVCGQTANPSCKTCWSGCACDQGFSRALNGTCVEASKCS